MKKYILIVILMTSTSILQGCVAAFVGAGAGAVKVAVDPRSTGTQVDDTSMDSKIGMMLKAENDYFKGSRIVASTYNGNVLLIGQAKSQSVINKAVSLVGTQEDINKIYNQIRIGEIVSAMTMTNDTWITTKIKSSFLTNQRIKSLDIKVITEDGEVFLMGILTRDEGAIAAEVASEISGVRLVTTMFTYVN